MDENHYHLSGPTSTWGLHNQLLDLMEHLAGSLYLYGPVFAIFFHHQIVTTLLRLGLGCRGK